MNLVKRFFYYVLGVGLFAFFTTINGIPLIALWDVTSLIFIGAGYLYALHHFSLRDILRVFNSDIPEDLQKAQYFLKQLGNYGLYAGTLALFLGFVHALGNLDEIKALGVAMALSVLPIFYALLIKVLVLLPWSNALEHKALPYKVNL